MNDITGTSIAMQHATTLLESVLPDAKLISVTGTTATIDTTASGEKILEAETDLRHLVGVPVELMCGRDDDKNKIRIKLAKFRGIKV